MMAPYVGHILPSLGFANALRAAGSTVIYIAFERHSERMEEWEFECEKIGMTWEEILVAEKERRIRRWNTLVDSLVNKVIEVITRRRIQILLVDPFLAVLTEASVKTAIPACYMYVFDGGSPSALRAPGTSRWIPNESILSAVTCSLLWLVHCLSVELRALLYMDQFLGSRARMRKTGRMYDLGMIYDLWGRHLAFPKILLYPSALEIRKVEGAIYAGLCVASRQEPTAQDVAKGPLKLVVCSLGTLPQMYKNSVDIFQACADAMQYLPDWEMILHVGVRGKVPNVESTSNVKVVRSMKLLDLLGRTAVMITHAGFGTVKECISAGVPMVAIPCDFDQFSNAARIVHLGLGVAAAEKSPTASSITALIGSADDAQIRKNISKIRARILMDSEPQSAIEIIHRMRFKSCVRNPIASRP